MGRIIFIVWLVGGCNEYRTIRQLVCFPCFDTPQIFLRRPSTGRLLHFPDNRIASRSRITAGAAGIASRVPAGGTTALIMKKRAFSLGVIFHPRNAAPIGAVPDNAVRTKQAVQIIRKLCELPAVLGLLQLHRRVFFVVRVGRTSACNAVRHYLGILWPDIRGIRCLSALFQMLRKGWKRNCHQYRNNRHNNQKLSKGKAFISSIAIHTCQFLFFSMINQCSNGQNPIKYGSFVSILPENRLTAARHLTFLFWKQDYRLHMARYLLIDVRFCARSRKHSTLTLSNFSLPVNCIPLIHEPLLINYIHTLKSFL